MRASRYAARTSPRVDTPRAARVCGGTEWTPRPAVKRLPDRAKISQVTSRVRLSRDSTPSATGKRDRLAARSG